MTHPLDEYFEKTPGMTRRKLAEQAGLSEMHLSRLIRGKGDFSTKSLRKIADATAGQVSVASLVLALESARSAQRNLRKHEAA